MGHISLLFQGNHELWWLEHSGIKVACYWDGDWGRYPSWKVRVHPHSPVKMRGIWSRVRVRERYRYSFWCRFWSYRSSSGATGPVLELQVQFWSYRSRFVSVLYLLHPAEESYKYILTRSGNYSRLTKVGGKKTDFNYGWTRETQSYWLQFQIYAVSLVLFDLTMVRLKKKSS